MASFEFCRTTRIFGENTFYPNMPEDKPYKRNPQISKYLLWEYNPDTFDYERSRKVVIERVIERGSLADWSAMVNYYGKESILEIVRDSRQLSERDKQFTHIFLDSTLLHAV